MNAHLARRARGFTLIEMLVVIVIIGVLAAVVAPRFFGRTDDAKIAAARAQISNFALALDAYQLDNGRYPTTDQGLKALVEKPSSSPVPDNWRGPYLGKKDLPLDPWKNPYGYVCPGTHNPDYDLYSGGKDGKPGGGGENADISNW